MYTYTYACTYGVRRTDAHCLEIEKKWVSERFRVLTPQTLQHHGEGGRRTDRDAQTQEQQQTETEAKAKAKEEGGGGDRDREPASFPLLPSLRFSGDGLNPSTVFSASRRSFPRPQVQIFRSIRIHGEIQQHRPQIHTHPSSQIV
jgi:hypothetical protein